MKLTVVGGGSTYTPELVDGLARLADAVKVTELVLVDPDQDQLGDLDVVGQPGDPVHELRGVGGPATDHGQFHPKALTSAPLRATWHAAS